MVHARVPSGVLVLLKTAEREYTFYLPTSTSEIVSSNIGKILHFPKFSVVKAAAERWYRNTFPFEYLALACERGVGS